MPISPFQLTRRDKPSPCQTISSSRLLINLFLHDVDIRQIYRSTPGIVYLSNVKDRSVLCRLQYEVYDHRIVHRCVVIAIVVRRQMLIRGDDVTFCSVQERNDLGCGSNERTSSLLLCLTVADIDKQ